jgi:hypothetical protein
VIVRGKDPFGRAATIATANPFQDTAPQFELSFDIERLSAACVDWEWLALRVCRPHDPLIRE